MINERSRLHLAGLHDDAVRLGCAVLTDVRVEALPGEMMIIDGLRTSEEQAQYVRDGLSKTMNSRHLTGHAWDFGVFVDGKYIKDADAYKPYGRLIDDIAKREGIQIEGGWEWGWDWGHVQLDWDAYPIGAQPPKRREQSTTIAAAGGISLVTIAQQVLEYLGAIDGQWTAYAALAVVLVLAGWIINERVLKARRDGV